MRQEAQTDVYNKSHNFRVTVPVRDKNTTRNSNLTLVYSKSNSSKHLRTKSLAFESKPQTSQFIRKSSQDAARTPAVNGVVVGDFIVQIDS